MSGGYDNRIVLGTGDANTSSWGANILSPVTIPMGAGVVSSVGFSGNSFYLDAIYIQCNGLIWTAGGAFTINVYNSPNATNIVGATAILAVDVVVPTAAPASPVQGPGLVVNLTNLKYHNNLGRNGFLLASQNVTINGGNVKITYAGGNTSLIT